MKKFQDLFFEGRDIVQKDCVIWVSNSRKGPKDG